MTTQREETNILKDIVERLRYAEDLPEEDDAAFRWYAYITEEAANKIESLRLQLAASQARELQLRGQILLMIDSWWPFVHGSFPSDTARDMFRKASDSIQPPYDTTALKAENEWQPIETAPKDGTVFLGCKLGQFRECYKVQRADCDMWCFGGTSGADDLFPNIKPTHWMPLPKPPAMAQGEK